MRGTPAAAASMQQGIDVVVDEAVEAGRVVEAVVLVQRHGQPLYARAVGWADREAGMR